MLIFELFDSPTPDVNVESDHPRRYVSSASINGRVIEFKANIISLHLKDPESRTVIKPAWEITFWELDRHGYLSAARTSSGGELQAFAFVISQVKYLIKKHSPDVITFSGAKDHGDDRETLYRKLALKLTGYKLEEQDFGSEVRFVLIKK
jgi:hypothetical protein